MRTLDGSAGAASRPIAWILVPPVIIESRIVGVRKDALADRLVLDGGTVGVVDGATAKIWDSPQAPTGVQVADCVAEIIEATAGRASDVVRRATTAVADLHSRAGVAPGSASAATFAAVVVEDRQVVRVGDAHVAVNGAQAERLPTGESVVARARALVLRQSLAAGMTVAELRRRDVGRDAIQPLLRALTGLRNVAVDGGYGAIDGRPVPDCFIELISLPDSACEVILATDGYPGIGQDLEESEKLLRERLAEDPLMIADPPATKGWMIGANSYDDRAFVRLSLAARG
jgi:hypothetical protein